MTSTQIEDWGQTAKTVTFQVRMANISIKKIDISIYDLVIKVNIPERREVILMDLHDKIDTQKLSHSIKLQNNKLKITLKKLKEIEWPHLQPRGFSKEQLKQRRKESFRRKEEEQQMYQKKIKDMKIKADTHATKQIMKLDQKEREYLDSTKQSIQDKETEDIAQVFEQLERRKEYGEDRTMPFMPQDNSIFGDEDIFDENRPEYEEIEEQDEESEEEEEPIPEPRKQTEKKIKFTKKTFHGIAERDFHKEKKVEILKGKKGGKDGHLNPLYLKSKGDEFFANKDYYSAISAYTQMIQADPGFLGAISNKIVCNMLLFNHKEALSDCEMLINQIEAFPEEQKEDITNIVLLRNTKIQKAMNLTWKGNIHQGILLFKEVVQDQSFTDEQKEKVVKTIEKLKIREESLKLKRLGDVEYKQRNLEEAMKYYENALELDPQNELSQANKSLIELKQKKYEQCIASCDAILTKIDRLTKYTNFQQEKKQSSNRILVLKGKLLLRKAVAFQESDKLKEALEIVKDAWNIKKEGKEAQILYKKIQVSFVVFNCLLICLKNLMIKKEVLSLKDEGNSQLRQKNFKGASETFSKCLKKLYLNDSNLIDYLSIMLNRTICFLKLGQYDDIISIGLRGIKLIHNYENRVISFEKVKKDPDFESKLRKIEISFLVRRGNSYLKQGQQVFHDHFLLMGLKDLPCKS